MGLSVDLHENLVQVPTPAARPHPLDAALSDLGGKKRPEPVPPKPHGLVADIDAAFVQQVLDIAKRERKPDIHHHRETDDLRRRLEVAKGRAFCHAGKIGAGSTGLKLSSFDKTSAAVSPELKHGCGFIQLVSSASHRMKSAASKVPVFTLITKSASRSPSVSP